ncbi:MAG: hypothetical protein WCY55_04875 [Anaerovoracaceae bacterium]
MSERKILCLSTSNYDSVPTRKQNVMNRLTDADILYVDPPVTWIAPLRDPAARGRLSAFRKGGRPGKGGVTVYASRPVLPFYNKQRRINRHNQKKMALYLADILKEHGFGTDFYVWCYSPASADLIAPLACALGIEEEALWTRTIYDCVDRHSAYPGLIDPAVVDGMERDLAKNAGVVFATADGLACRLSAWNSNTHLIPNGVDYELFSRVADMTSKPDRPLTLGFVGMLQECIDYDAIRAAARAFPEGRIVLIGGVLPGVDLNWLNDYPNVMHLGLVSQAQLPNLMADFHACLNVFAQNELSKHVSPLKFYEYLATGKPVVSTPYPLQVQAYRSCIYIGDTTEEFVAKCAEAAAEPQNDPRKAERMLIAGSASWDERLKEMRAVLGWGGAAIHSDSLRSIAIHGGKNETDR